MSKDLDLSKGKVLTQGHPTVRKVLLDTRDGYETICSLWADDSIHAIIMPIKRLEQAGGLDLYGKYTIVLTLDSDPNKLPRRWVIDSIRQYGQFGKHGPMLQKDNYIAGTQPALRPESNQAHAMLIYKYLDPVLQVLLDHADFNNVIARREGNDLVIEQADYNPPDLSVDADTLPPLAIETGVEIDQLNDETEI